eukprot:jgi/Mesvir1/28761/Mv19728-RA.1
MTRAFLDINIGHAAEHEQQLAAYNRAKTFLARCGSQYGLPEDAEPSALDQDQKDLLMEAYSGDPTWSVGGPIQLDEVASLCAGRIVVELYDSDAPKAVENFSSLITGEKGKSKNSGKMLAYKGCPFHRIVKGFVVQGGDFVRGDGSGGESIWGGKFKDEKGGLKRTHDAVGVVGMANSGKDSNSSQFYITLVAPLKKLDGKHVVIGQVVEGLDILKRINDTCATADGEPPLQPVTIADCGLC